MSHANIYRTLTELANTTALDSPHVTSLPMPGLDGRVLQLVLLVFLLCVVVVGSGAAVSFLFFRWSFCQVDKLIFTQEFIRQVSQK